VIDTFVLMSVLIYRKFKDIHQNHINISRFSNTSPFLFATSSFDKTVKMWDARISLTSNCCPIYSCSSKQGHVMLCFSPDDVFLLTSAVDNEVSQYHAVDGRLHFRLDAPTPPNTASQQENFTRRYALYTYIQP
jgi:WD40 repeat protein